MNKQDLLQKELSNFYAINKQVNHYFNGSEVAFLSENKQLALMDYLKTVCEVEDHTANMLDQLDFNPTNTKDSIVEEITENLNEIANKNIDTQVKAIGYSLSVNRLIAYQIANLENLTSFNTNNKQQLIQYKATLASIKDKMMSS